ncbi:MAG: hypothetical protein J6J36_05675 [Clostridia bacterium]|nr:hypothetical protein [Clostridia bacterium]
MNAAYVYETYKQSNNSELLKYMSPKQIFQLYRAKEIGINEVGKYTSLVDLLAAQMDVEEKIKMLISGNGSRIYNHSESDIIWEYFEKGYFNPEQMAKLEKFRYFHLNSVIKNYQQDKKRKIATELGIEPIVSEEKLFLIFTPEIVLRELRKGVSNEIIDFYNVDLKRIYDEKIREYGESEEYTGSDIENSSTKEQKNKIEQEVIAVMQAEYKQENKSTEEFYRECLDIYDKGFLSLDSLAHIEMPENIATEYLDKHNNEESLLIKFFNANIISQDYIMELYPDDFEYRALELVQDGMSCRVLSGMYSTGELIERSGVMNLDVVDEYEKQEETDICPITISLEGLAELKDEIKTGLEEDKIENGAGKKETTILSLYLDNRLTYENLKAFADAGIISENEFYAIEEKYNVSEALTKLKQNGLFSKKVYKETESTSSRIIGPNESKKQAASIGNVIDRELIKLFYEAIGMEPEDFVAVDATKCPIFEGYMLIPDVKRRLCYLEGDKGTRTYIIPLKYVIEQMEHPGSQNDIIGNSKSRRDFAKKLEAVGTSANHTANWGKNMIDKIAEVSARMTLEEKKAFRKEHDDIIQAIADSYKGIDKKKNR